MKTGIHDNRATQQRELWIEDGHGRRLTTRPRWQVDADVEEGLTQPWGTYPDRPDDQQPELE